MDIRHHSHRNKEAVQQYIVIREIANNIGDKFFTSTLLYFSCVLNSKLMVLTCISNALIHIIPARVLVGIPLYLQTACIPF